MGVLSPFMSKEKLDTTLDKHNSALAEFDQYLEQPDPSRREKAAAWKTAVGLQAVDGLHPSQYLLHEAKRHVEGEVSIDELRKNLYSYYEQRAVRGEIDRPTEEADKVSANISRYLSKRVVNFTVTGFLLTHRAVFNGVFPFAGEIRTCNLSKNEWVLNGDSVYYMDYEDIMAGLDYDLGRERKFRYAELSTDEAIAHLADFTSGLWQIHAFREGNTRTVAVFLIQYLRSMGFDADNEVFADNAWYFRNALVRAVYRNVRTHVDPEPQYLIRFFRNLLLGEKNELQSRYLLVNV